MHKIALASALVFLTAIPAMAGPLCLGRGGAHVTFGIEIGDFSESERDDFYLMKLRQRGVDATDVRTWGQCLQVFVRKPGGGEEMQYFDPSTLERVQ